MDAGQRAAGQHVAMVRQAETRIGRGITAHQEDFARQLPQGCQDALDQRDPRQLEEGFRLPHAAAGAAHDDGRREAGRGFADHRLPLNARSATDL